VRKDFVSRDGLTHRKVPDGQDDRQMMGPRLTAENLVAVTFFFLLSLLAFFRFVFFLVFDSFLEGGEFGVQELNEPRRSGCSRLQSSRLIYRGLCVAGE
jgi:hypothetical protein